MLICKSYVKCPQSMSGRCNNKSILAFRKNNQEGFDCCHAVEQSMGHIFVDSDGGKHIEFIVYDEVANIRKEVDGRDIEQSEI